MTLTSTARLYIVQVVSEEKSFERVDGRTTELTYPLGTPEPLAHHKNIKRGSVFTFGDKIWIDVHVLSEITGNKDDILLKTGKIALQNM